MLVVIYLFLLDWRATLIPGLAMPVALIGTIAAIYLAGFSINILTLLALVLATGLVVDDAIVVLENIVRRRNEGMGPRAAAVLGTQEVFFAVIATTATLAAVFVPLSFLPGQTGGLFREFGFVLAMAVLLSCVVALTLCPMLASRMLTAHARRARPWRHRWRASAAASPALYRRCLRACLERAADRACWCRCCSRPRAYGAFGLIRQELTPTEDRSLVLLRINAPQGVSLDYTTQQMRRIEELIQPLRDSGEIDSTFANAGQGGSDQQRLHGADAGALGRARAQPAGDHRRHHPAGRRQVPGVRVFADAAQQPRHPRRRQRPAVRARRQQLRRARRRRRSKIIAEMEKDPRFQQPRLSTDATQPQLSVEIDRERASDLGIDITGLADARAGDARRPRDRRGLHRRPQLRGEAGLDHQSDQRSDRPGEHLPEDRRRPLRADVDHRHADRARRAAVAGARAAAARRSPSPPTCAPDFALGEALTPSRSRSPRRCCRPAAASSRLPRRRRSARPTAAC